MGVAALVSQQYSCLFLDWNYCDEFKNCMAYHLNRKIGMF